MESFKCELETLSSVLCTAIKDVDLDVTHGLSCVANVDLLPGLVLLDVCFYHKVVSPDS